MSGKIIGGAARSRVPTPANAWTRRAALKFGAAAGASFAGALIGGAAPFPANAQFAPIIPPPANPNFPQVPAWETEVRELAPNVYAYIQGGGPGKNNVAVSNAMFVVGDDGVFLVDSLAAPLHAKALVAAVREVTSKPFKYVVNTHHHGDHVLGNQFIPDNPEIISHPYCREEVLAMPHGPAVWQKREGWANGDEPRKVLPATTTIEGKTTYFFGKTVVELLPIVPAHSYGDIVAYLPQHKIMALGDIGFFYVVPFCIHAHPSEWIRTCDRLGAMADLFVPGHGPVGGKAHFAEMADYLRLLRVEARKRYDARLSPGAAAADITLGKYDNWIGPQQIVMNVSRFYMEFEGTLTPAANLKGLSAAVEEYNAIMRGRGRA